MKTLMIRFETILILASILLTSIACNQGTAPANTAGTNAAANDANTATAASDVAKFSDDELDELLARIALYPDPLLAQVIPAATFVDQLKDAQGTLNGSSDDAQIADRDWDVSVKSVAHYPGVLKMMVDDEPWTTSLGQAYVLQPEDVGTAIQRLRAQAMDVGNLETTPQQEIVENGEVINIYPAQPKTIYVPQYNAETVYTEAPQQESNGMSTGAVIATAAIAFGAGLLIGSWLNNDYDYYGGRGIYYHGWNSGPAWVNVNRAYYGAYPSPYINNRYSTINVNRNVVHHSTTAYRRNVTLNSGLRRSRVDAARINNINRAPNGRLRTNAGNHFGQNKINPNIDRNRLNGNPNPGGGNRGGSPKINGGSRSLPNSGSRNPGGARPTTQPRNLQNRSAQPQQRSAPSRQSSGSGGGRRRP